MNTQERLRSLSDMLDSLESMELKPNLTFEDYKKLTRKITIMLFSAYNTGYENGYKQGKEDSPKLIDGGEYKFSPIDWD